jgi:hypothetical protein
MPILQIGYWRIPRSSDHLISGTFRADSCKNLHMGLNGRLGRQLKFVNKPLLHNHLRGLQAFCLISAAICVAGYTIALTQGRSMCFLEESGNK